MEPFELKIFLENSNFILQSSLTGSTNHVLIKLDCNWRLLRGKNT